MSVRVQGIWMDDGERKGTEARYWGGGEGSSAGVWEEKTSAGTVSMRVSDCSPVYIEMKGIISNPETRCP